MQGGLQPGASLSTPASFKIKIIIKHETKQNKTK